MQRLVSALSRFSTKNGTMFTFGNVERKRSGPKAAKDTPEEVTCESGKDKYEETQIRREFIQKSPFMRRNPIGELHASNVVGKTRACRRPARFVRPVSDYCLLPQ